MRLFELDAGLYDRVKPLFRPLDYHLAATAILERTVRGAVYVADVESPGAVLARVGHRFILAGAPDSPAFNAALERFFAEKVYPEGIASGAGGFALYYDSEGWEPLIEVLLKDKDAIRAQREYYQIEDLGQARPAILPAGYELRPADRALLDDERLENLEALREEMCSERATVDEFVEASFGVCPIYDNTLIGWCLSEYNTGDACEVGIATLPPHQRRGIATALMAAFVDVARERGIAHIGWHCFARNIASGATARKAGLQKTRDYPAYLSRFA